MKTACVIARSRIPTKFVLWSRVGVTAEVSSLKGGLSFHAGVTAGEDLRDSPEDVIEPQAVPDFMDHCVCVAGDAVEGRIQHDATCMETMRSYCFCPVYLKILGEGSRECLKGPRSSLCI